MKKMGKNSEKKGFTIIEVSLFLAITVAIMIAFMATIASRIGNQRYNDATQSFLSFLRSVYSQAVNVENYRSPDITIDSQNYTCTLASNISGADISSNNSNTSYPGRSDCAIYGKMVTFGENPDSGHSDDERNRIYVYDVIGQVVDFHHPVTAGSVAFELKQVYADVLSFDNDNSSTGFYNVNVASEYTYYVPEWDTWIQKPDGTVFEGTVLIVRSPSGGAVRTLFLDRAIQVQETINDTRNQELPLTAATATADRIQSDGRLIYDYLAPDNDSDPAFVMEDVNFCIGTDSFFSGVSQRNNVRIRADGRGSTAVELVETDKAAADGGNVCRR